MARTEHFRLRRPSRCIENLCIPPGQEVNAWLGVLEWLREIKPERLDSFRIQINLKPEHRAEEQS